MTAFKHDANNDLMECTGCVYTIITPTANFFPNDGIVEQRPNPFLLDADNVLKVDPNKAESIDAENFQKITFELKIEPPNGGNSFTETITVHIVNVNDNLPLISFTHDDFVNEPDARIGKIQITDLDQNLDDLNVAVEPDDGRFALRPIVKFGVRGGSGGKPSN